ncbi:hypothetical protein ACROYT_G009285 [Oculina patagonica]
MVLVFFCTLWLGTSFTISIQANSKDFVGILTGDDKLTVFADGRLVGHNGRAWNAARWLSFSSNTKIIAVLVYNGPGIGHSGFLGVFSNGVVTDRSWKCKETNNPENGWEQTNFTDDAWPYAYIRQDNSGRSGVSRVHGIPYNVHWISPANHNATRFICRRRFSTVEKSRNKTLIAIRTAEVYTNIIWLYLDGVFTTRAKGSLALLKDQHDFLAVQVEGHYFVASSSNGVRTDKSWRCTNVYHGGWFLPSYNDSSWPRVHVHSRADETYFVAPDAKWIRCIVASGYNRIFCRQTKEPDPQVPYGNSSADLQTSVSSLVPRITNVPTNSITSTTMVMKTSPATTHTTTTIPSPTGSHSFTSTSRVSVTSYSSNTDTNGLSALVIVLITVSGGVTAVIIGLAGSCYIWRKRRNRRKKSNTKLLRKSQRSNKWEMKRDDVTVCEELGHGAFGKVFKGIMKVPSSKKEAKSTITVAVKMLQENATPDQKKDFLDEINLMKVVGSHKNIVSLIGCCIKSSPNFLIVEFASHGDLLCYLRARRKKIKDTKLAYADVREMPPPPPITPRSLSQTNAGSLKPGIDEIGEVSVAFLKSNSSIDIKINSPLSLKKEEQDVDEDDSLSSQDIMSFSWQISKGMQYLSGKGIIHRDLAARNVLVCDNKLVKVADFGLARNSLEENVYHRTGQHNKLPVKWMPPEAIDDGVFTTKSDVPVEAAPDIPATAATGTPITIPTPVSEVAKAPEDRAAVTAPRQTTE